MLLGLFDIVVVAKDGVSRARIVGIVEFDVWDRCMREGLGAELGRGRRRGALHVRNAIGNEAVGGRGLGTTDLIRVGLGGLGVTT